MAYVYTVEDAARELGVSKARVYQLIDANALAAEKVSGIWLIDEQGVEARRAVAPQAGRPPAHARSKERACRYTLMNRAHEVLEFSFDVEGEVFLDDIQVIDATRTPVGLVSPRGKRVSPQGLAYWWKHRSIPKTRRGVEAKLRELGVEDSFLLPFRSMGLSLSDQFWIRPHGSDIKWEDVNFFHNDFGELSAEGGWLDEVGLESPDNTSEGELSKAWLCDHGVRSLVKGGTALGQEPYNEVVATALYRRLLRPDEYATYRLSYKAGEPVCLCDVFITDREEYVSAYYVRQTLRQANHHSNYQHYLECCARLGVTEAELAVSKMIVCDDILGNFDRHWRNFGLVRNVETLEYRVAPLFDSGSSLWCHTPETRLRSGDFSFETKPFYEDANRQLRLVNDYSWFNPSALEGFADEAAEILAANEALSSRVDYIRAAIQSRIDRIFRLL